MRTVTFKSVLDRIAGYLAEADGLSTEDVALATSKVNLFIRLAWQHYWWPETMEVERRYFGLLFGEQATAPGDVVYYPATEKYYQCLQYASALSVPASKDASGCYQTDPLIWIEAATCYDGADYDADTEYAPGDIVRHPASGEFYARSGGLRTADSSTASLNRDWTITGTLNGASLWGTEAAGDQNIHLAAEWIVEDNDSHQGYMAVDDAVTPDQVQTWTGVGATPGPYPTFTTSFTVPAPTDLGYWGLLSPFIRRIEYDQPLRTAIGLVRDVWSANPEVRHARRLSFEVRNGFVQVLGCASVVWVEFQRKPPLFTSVLRDDEASYGADVTLYDTETGDCWTTLEAVSPGESPTSAPSSWSKVEFPEFLAEFVAQSSYAMMTNREQQTPEDFGVELSAGYPLLLAEMDNIERKQGQVRQLNVRR